MNEENIIDNIYYIYYQTKLGNNSYFNIFDYIIRYNETKVNNLYVYSKIFDLYKILLNHQFMNDSKEFKKLVGDIVSNIVKYDCGNFFVNELNNLILYYIQLSVHLSF